MRWFKQLFSRQPRYDELSASIREHLAEKIDALMEGGMSREDAESNRTSANMRIHGLLRLFGIHGDRDVALSSYSKSMRQKILLSAALMHNPDVILLDEPFSGLDVGSALIL
jgi:ABC-type uncharacterized transport system ATPase subunit